MDKDFQDRIDDYILGRMSEDDKVNFKAEVSLDESKREQLEFTKNVNSAVNSRQDKLKGLERMKAIYDQEKHKRSASVNTRQIVLWASGVAAVFVVGFFVFKPLIHDTIPVESSPGIMITSDNYVFGVKDSIVDLPIVNDSIIKDTSDIIIEEVCKEHE